MSEITRIAQAVLSRGPASPEIGPAFEIYRNNYRQGLARALAQSFPVVQLLVGDAFFGAMALEYVELTPPTSRLLRAYGETFADFIGRFAPAATVPYLADVAKLEFALVQSFYADDLEDEPIRDLAAIGVESQLQWRSSTQLIGSQYPIVSIWRAHIAGEHLDGLDWLPESGLIVRDGHAVGIQTLRAAEAQLADLFRVPTSLVSALEVLGPEEAPAAAQAIRRLLDLNALRLFQ
ncbi:DNA-binding domain-containing protein [Caulobacter henricii]|uniref:Putative DNA-binding domain-containing protein n=1 Tax=Caulobacter henricii TaxID=69395 RepID=A0A0P0NYC8_9CAUL|nr:DNA-binding domain-containing protein [Caulobacter henricii]ALL13137.1 hypothetical protein AQ619_07105 [Caulobacter henricii]